MTKKKKNVKKTKKVGKKIRKVKVKVKKPIKKTVKKPVPKPSPKPTAPKVSAKNAFISVYNKDGIAKFAKELKKLGYNIISTGGTAKALIKAKVPAIDIATFTNYPSILGGRVKSLHPLIHGGILAIRKDKKHQKDIKQYNIPLIDIVVCNLYPFEEVISAKKFTHEEAIENIDIGGPGMVRAAAKNYQDVAVIVDPADYAPVLEELRKNKGVLSVETKEKLAAKAFEHTAKYDRLIADYFLSRAGAEKKSFSDSFEIDLQKIQDLRYGENPHQKAAFYKEKGANYGMVAVEQLHGKELSFTNILDLDAAWAIVNHFPQPTVAIIKHTNPCGVAIGKNIFEAYEKAFASDPKSAFGGIVASNRPIDKKTAQDMNEVFLEAVIAPAYDADALKVLKEKQNLRIMLMPRKAIEDKSSLDLKRISGGMLLQEKDARKIETEDMKVVTRRNPSQKELQDLIFAWGIVKHVKSNAIVVAKNLQTFGIGAGQMSRVDSVDIALRKAEELATGAALASDAFFPFRDSIDLAARAGITAIIHPGGSIRDQEVIQAADENGIAMVFTGIRHFKH